MVSRTGRPEKSDCQAGRCSTTEVPDFPRRPAISISEPRSQGRGTRQASDGAFPQQALRRSRTSGTPRPALDPAAPGRRPFCSCRRSPPNAETAYGVPHERHRPAWELSRLSPRAARYPAPTLWWPSLRYLPEGEMRLVWSRTRSSRPCGAPLRSGETFPHPDWLPALPLAIRRAGHRHAGVRQGRCIRLLFPLACSVERRRRAHPPLHGAALRLSLVGRMRHGALRSPRCGRRTARLPSGCISSSLLVELPLDAPPLRSELRKLVHPMLGDGPFESH